MARWWLEIMARDGNWGPICMWVIELLGLGEEFQLPVSERQEAKQKGGVQSTLARPQGEDCMTDGPGPDTGHKGAGLLLRLHYGVV